MTRPSHMPSSSLQETALSHTDISLPSLKSLTSSPISVSVSLSNSAVATPIIPPLLNKQTNVASVSQQQQQQQGTRPDRTTLPHVLFHSLSDSAATTATTTATTAIHRPSSYDVSPSSSSLPSFFSTTTTTTTTTSPRYNRHPRHHNRHNTWCLSLSRLPDTIRYHFATPSSQLPLTPRRTTLPSSVHRREQSFTLGLVADVQYARRPTHRSITTITLPSVADGIKVKTVNVRRRRSWNETLKRLQEAISYFNRCDVDYVVNLGDIIEGYSSSSSLDVTTQLPNDEVMVPGGSITDGTNVSSTRSSSSIGSMRVWSSRRRRRLLRRSVTQSPGVVSATDQSHSGIGGGGGDSGSGSGGGIGHNLASAYASSSFSVADSLLASADDLRVVLDEFHRLHMPVLHVIGNHCRSLPHADLCRLLRIHGRGYYSFDLTMTWKLLVLHTAELHTQAVDARPGIDDDLLSNILLSEGRPVDISFHGAVSDDQLKWLKYHVDKARVMKQKVIVASHYPLADNAARISHVLANTRKIRDIVEMDDTPVALCLAGHDHLGGYLYCQKTKKRGAVTYVTMPAMLEATPKMNAFGVVTAFADGSVIVNAGPNSPASCAIDASELEQLDE